MPRSSTQQTAPSSPKRAAAAYRRLSIPLLVTVAAAGCGVSVPVDTRDTTRRVTSIRVPREERAIQHLREMGAAVAGGTPEFVDAYVWPEDVATLSTQRIDVEVISKDYRSLRPRSASGYHDSVTSIAALETLAQNHPDIVRLVDVGASQQGRPIVGVIIASDVWARTAKPALRILGAHHGNEWSSMEVALELARVLATSYDVDSDVRALLDAHEIWVIPVVNPDGIEQFRRENARGVDLNRNYSYEWRDWTGGGERPFSESETDAVRAASMRRSFSQSLSFHSGAAYCASIWGCCDEVPSDAEMITHMCGLYLANTDMPNFWFWGWDQEGGGYTFGDTNDWSYGVRGGIDYTIEVTQRSTPSEEAIPEFLDWHIAPSLALLQETRAFGVMGVVADATTGVPLEARITLLPDGQPVYSDPDSGLFHRLTFPGEHQLLVEAPGYQAKTVSVTVATGTATRVDVPIVPTAPAGVALWRAEPSVVPVHGGSVQVWLRGQGLQGWAESVRLSRFDADEVSLPVEEQGDALVFTVDPADLGERYTREGFYWITVSGSGRDVSLPRGLVVTSKTDTGTRLIDVVAENGASVDGLHRVSVNGDSLPRGADILLIGPSGSVVVPRRTRDESQNQHVVVLDPRTLVDGIWDVVVFGHACYFALDDALETENGLFFDRVADGTEPDDTNPDDSNPDDSEPDDADPDSTSPHGAEPLEEVELSGLMSCSTNTPSTGAGWVFFVLFAWVARRARLVPLAWSGGAVCLRPGLRQLVRHRGCVRVFRRQPAKVDHVTMTP